MNGRPARIGEKLSGAERVLFDGKPIELSGRDSAAQGSHLAYYKTAGEISTASDPEHRHTVFESLPRPSAGRWISVGRLDVSTSGLLLFTTDGALAHRLMHPSSEIKRSYSVRVLGTLDSAARRELLTGVELDDGPARFDSIEDGGGTGANRWYTVTLHGGRNREVRRLMEAAGHAVSRLIRTRFGPIELGALRRGEYRYLSRSEVASLYKSVGLQDPDRR